MLLKNRGGSAISIDNLFKNKIQIVCLFCELVKI